MREVLGRVGDKWSVLAIALLGDGTKRFNELCRTIDALRLIRFRGRFSYATSAILRSYAAGLIRPADECRRRWL